MANNRMYLIHRPTGTAIMLGKRMGWGWYQPPTGEQMERFFEASEEQRQDDFYIGMECLDEANHNVILTSCVCSPPGFRLEDLIFIERSKQHESNK